MKRSYNATQIAFRVQRLGNNKGVLGRVSRWYHHSSFPLLGIGRFQNFDHHFGKVRQPQHTTRSCCRIDVWQSSRRFSSSDTTTTSQQQHDPHDRFRNGTLTEDVWREIQEENERTRRSIDPQLYEQVLGEIWHAMESIPPPIPELGPTGNYAYSFVDDLTRNRRIYRRQPYVSASSLSDATGRFQTVVDISALDDNLLAMSLSVDETLVACLLDRQPKSGEGGEGSHANGGRNMLLVRHIDSETEIQIDVPPKADDDGDISSVELGPLQTDGVGRHSLFYVTNDAKGRPAAVWACTVAWDDETRTLRQDSNPILLKRFTNPKIMASVQRTKGCQYVNIQGTTKTDNEVFLCRDVSAPEPLQLVMPRQDGVMYHVDAGDNDAVYMLISRDGIRLEHQSLNAIGATGIEYSLWKTSTHSLPVTAENFGTLLASDESGYAIYDMDIFKSFIACYERSKTNGSQRIRLLRHQTACAGAHDNTTNIISPLAIAQEDCGTISPEGNIHFQANSIRFVVESPADPPKSYEYDINSECLRLISEYDTKSIPANIQKKKILVTSQDGTAVPLSLVYRETAKSAAKNDTKQVVLFGYGSYGEPMDLSFQPCLQPLLNRGFVLAYCHSRGGGDLGRSWYHQGRLYCKPKAIEDFIACAEALSSSSLGISEPRKITAKGFSAGGVLIGAAVNQRPELFGTVVMTNAFLDVRKTMMRESLFLTEHEYDEYGDPIKDPKAASLIASYCPVSNAGEKEKKIRYLIIGAFDDVQVPFWNTIIYGKKIRKTNRKGSDVLVHIESHGGHNMQIHVAALETAFIIGNRAAYYGIEFEE